MVRPLRIRTSVTLVDGLMGTLGQYSIGIRALCIIYSLSSHLLALHRVPPSGEQCGIIISNYCTQ